MNLTLKIFKSMFNSFYDEKFISIVINKILQAIKWNILYALNSNISRKKEK